MLQDLLESARLPADGCARILNVEPKLFAEWVAGRRPIPDSYARNLATMLGTSIDEIRAVARPRRSGVDRTPAVWFKLRDDRLRDRDREYVALVRHLAFLVDQFEKASDSPSRVWESIFTTIRQEVLSDAPAREQGKRAARLLRSARGLGQGATGIGEVIRGNLRAAGILVVETPLPDSKLEGCSFYVAGVERTSRPCIFANTHRSTWFRRNAVLLHETAHLIFDAMSAGTTIDFLGEEQGVDIIEQRADAFAQEVLIPFEVLRHATQKYGIDWSTIDAKQMALLMADTHAEQRLIVDAALDAALVSTADADRARHLETSAELPAVTPHALSAVQYFQKNPAMKELHLKREATLPSIPLRLPLGYVKAVAEAVANSTIAWTKASELLMIDRPTFLERFGDVVPTDE